MYVVIVLVVCVYRIEALYSLLSQDNANSDVRYIGNNKLLIVKIVWVAD